MEINSLTDLRPRTVWDIVDDAFDLYREKFSLFASITAIVFVPAYVIYFALTASTLGEFTAQASKPGGNPFDLFRPLFNGFAVWGPLFLGAYVLQQGATAIAVDDQLQGRNATLKTAYQRALRRFFPLILSAIVVGLLASIGVCALYVGTFIVLAYYAFVPQAVVLENKSVFASVKRSSDLAGNFFGKSLGLLCLTALIMSVLSGGVQGILEIVTLLLPKTGDVASSETQQLVLKQAISAVVYLLLYPLTPIATTLLYYDLRVRREGFDLASEARRIGYELAPDPFGETLNPKLPKPVKPARI